MQGRGVEVYFASNWTWNAGRNVRHRWHLVMLMAIGEVLSSAAGSSAQAPTAGAGTETTLPPVVVESPQPRMKASETKAPPARHVSAGRTRPGRTRSQAASSTPPSNAGPGAAGLQQGAGAINVEKIAIVTCAATSGH
jgi:hypothetical protein